MSLSSVTVVFTALRLRFFKPVTTSVQPQVEQKNNIKTQEERKTMEKELTIKGMMCAHCQKHVFDALSAMPGVTKVDVDLAAGKAKVVAAKDIPQAEFAKVINFYLFSCYI